MFYLIFRYAYIKITFEVLFNNYYRIIDEMSISNDFEILSSINILTFGIDPSIIMGGAYLLRFSCALFLKLQNRFV